MNEVKIWVLAGSAGLLSAILGYAIKIVTGEVIKRLDAIVDELKQLTRATTVQEQLIKRLQDQAGVTHQRLHEHAARIHTLESKIINNETKP